MAPAPPRHPPDDRVRLLRAPLIADAEGVLAAPGAILLRGRKILAAGAPEAIGLPHSTGVSGDPAPGSPETQIVDFPGMAILPALANAHTHLDLTHLGPIRYGGSFERWIERVRAGRATAPEEIAESVDEGIQRSLAGGVAAVGDIAGVQSLVPLDRLRRSVLRGVSFFEIFGLGVRQQRACELLRRVVEETPLDLAGVRLGLQPHAPYSCGPTVFATAAELSERHGVPLATHLAETLEELEFTRSASGPLAEFLRRAGVWDDSIEALGGHPLDALGESLRRGRWLAVHLNYIEPQHVAAMARLGVTAVYCPRASAYFGHPEAGESSRPFGPHRYRELLAAGVPVAVGTDSLLCLDTPDRISPLDDLRLLWRRDGSDPRALLAMATTSAATALGLDPARHTLAVGEPSGLIAVPLDGDGLEGVMRSTEAPTWVLEPTKSVLRG